MKIFSRKAIACIFLIISLLLTSGVYATWHYYYPTDYVSADLSIQLGLPNYPEEGYDHQGILDKVIGVGDNLENSLNGGNTFINRVISARHTGSNTDGIIFSSGRDTVGSMAIALKEEFGTFFENQAKNVDFVLWFPNGPDTSPYYIFTWEILERDSKGYASQLPNANGGAISKNNVAMSTDTLAPTTNVWVDNVYRTTVEKIDGVWTQTVTEKGIALASFYEENYNGSWLTGNRYKSKLLSIYPQSWIAN